MRFVFKISYFLHDTKTVKASFNNGLSLQGPLSGFWSFDRSGTHKANATDAVANMKRRGAHFTHAGTPALFVQHATWQVINPQFSDSGLTWCFHNLEIE